MTDDERHRRQGYGTKQREQFRQKGFNPWLYDRDDDTDMGKLTKLWETSRR